MKVGFVVVVVVEHHREILHAVASPTWRGRNYCLNTFFIKVFVYLHLLYRGVSTSSPLLKPPSTYVRSGRHASWTEQTPACWLTKHCTTPYLLPLLQSEPIWCSHSKYYCDCLLLLFAAFTTIIIFNGNIFQPVVSRHARTPTYTNL